jgi:hypothetical protein
MDDRKVKTWVDDGKRACRIGVEMEGDVEEYQIKRMGRRRSGIGKSKYHNQKERGSTTRPSRYTVACLVMCEAETHRSVFGGKKDGKGKWKRKVDVIWRGVDAGMVMVDGWYAEGGDGYWLGGGE